MLRSLYQDSTYYLKNMDNGYNLKFIDGKIRNAKSSSGYCNWYGHRGHLTEKQECQHKCHSKSCIFYFERYKETDERYAY